MLKAVTFDLWNTVLKTLPDHDKLLKEIRTKSMQVILDQFGYLININDLYRAYDKSSRILAGIWEQAKELNTKAQLEIFLKSISQEKFEVTPTLYQALKKPYIEAIFKAPPLPMDKIVNTIKNLKEANYKLGLISNTGRTPGMVLRKLLKKYGLVDYFDVLTFSNESKIRKPKREIFLRTITKLSIQPEEAVHVGDDIKNDVYGAKNAGMKAVLFSKFNLMSLDIEPNAVITTLEELPTVLKKL